MIPQRKIDEAVAALDAIDCDDVEEAHRKADSIILLFLEENGLHKIMRLGIVPKIGLVMDFGTPDYEYLPSHQRRRATRR